MQKLRAVLGLLAGIALAFAATAAGADGYRRGGVKDTEPCCNAWQGFYLGIHGGYGWKDNDFTEVRSVVPRITIEGIQSKGALWGAHAGYNWQYGHVVTGLELDFSAANISGESTASAGGFTRTLGDDVKYLGSARARLGYALGSGCCSGFLLYATAGLAWERVERFHDDIDPPPATLVRSTSRDPRDHFGWVAGIGAEAKLGGSNWVARIEYLHYDFGSVQPTDSRVSTVPGTSFSDRSDSQTIEVVRAALSYKF